MANENSNSLNDSNMPTRFTSIEELYDYQNGLPDPFATVTTVTPVDNVRISLPVDPFLAGSISNPAMLDYDDGKEQLQALDRDEYFLFKVFLNPDGAELIKRYQNDSPFQKYPSVDIFIYYEWTDKYDLTGTICFVRFSKKLSDFIRNDSTSRSPEAIAQKIADNYNRKKDQPYHDEINPNLITEAIIFQQDKGKITTGIVKTVVNKILAEICFFAAKQTRKGKYGENVWKNPADKNYSPLIKVAELEILKNALIRIQTRLASFIKILQKLSQQATKAGFKDAASLIDILTEVTQSFEKSILELIHLIELGQQAVAVINAILCGSTNALVEMVAGLVELIGIVFSMDDKANKQLIYESLENAIQVFRQRPLAVTFNEKIDEIKDRYNSRELLTTEIAYNAGEDIVEVAMLLAIVRDLIMLLRKIPQLGEFTKTAEKVLKKDVAKAVEATDKGTDYLLNKLYSKPHLQKSKINRIKTEFEIDLFQKKADDPIQVWYKDTKIFEGDETTLKKWLDDLDDKNPTNRKKFLEEAWDKAPIEFINDFTKEKIINLPKGDRPDPSKYLKIIYIEEHLKRFEKGVSFILPKPILEKYGRDIIGRIDGQFVIPTERIDVIIANAKGDVSVLEKALGIPQNSWRNMELVRIDIKNIKNLNLRIPSGNESGANILWEPGGKTINGYRESVIDAVKKGNYKETLIKIKQE